MRFSINKLSQKLAQHARLAPFAAALALLLVFVQSADLIHTHDELAQQIDCEICLKFGSDDDVIADDSSFSTPLAQSVEPVLLQTDWAPVADSTARARAPPLA